MRYRIPLKLLVIKNNMLNQIAWEQMMFLGNPQFACELQPIDFALAAEAIGASATASPGLRTSMGFLMLHLPRKAR